MDSSEALQEGVNEVIECIEDENTLVTEKISQSKFAYFVFKLNYYKKLNATMASLIDNKKVEV